MSANVASIQFDALQHVICQLEMDVHFVTKHNVRSSESELSSCTIAIVYTLIYTRWNYYKELFYMIDFLDSE